MRDGVLFGPWLKSRRKALDLTQQDLAARVGCAAATIRKFEAGERRPSKQVAERLAGSLDIPLEEQAAFVHFARGVAEVAPAPGPGAEAAGPAEPAVAFPAAPAA